MTYRVVATEIIDDTDRVVFNALDNKLIRRKLCQEMNRAESEEADNASLRGTLRDEIMRAEAAEARAAQLETDNDAMQSYINEIRIALHTEKDELTIEAVRRVISERDELARNLEQAQRNISAYDKAERALNQAFNEGDGVYRP